MNPHKIYNHTKSNDSKSIHFAKLVGQTSFNQNYIPCILLFIKEELLSAEQSLSSKYFLSIILLQQCFLLCQEFVFAQLYYGQIFPRKLILQQKQLAILNHLFFFKCIAKDLVYHVLLSTTTRNLVYHAPMSIDARNLV